MSGLAGATSTLEVMARLAAMEFDRMDGTKDIGLPFQVLYQNPDGEFRLWCPHLNRQGRCGIHSRRPELCHEFKAGSNYLCVEYVPSLEDLEDLKMVMGL